MADNERDELENVDSPGELAKALERSPSNWDALLDELGRSELSQAEIEAELEQMEGEEFDTPESEVNRTINYVHSETLARRLTSDKPEQPRSRSLDSIKGTVEQLSHRLTKESDEILKQILEIGQRLKDHEERLVALENPPAAREESVTLNELRIGLKGPTPRNFLVNSTPNAELLAIRRRLKDQEVWVTAVENRTTAAESQREMVSLEPTDLPTLPFGANYLRSKFMAFIEDKNTMDDMNLFERPQYSMWAHKVLSEMFCLQHQEEHRAAPGDPPAAGEGPKDPTVRLGKLTIGKLNDKILTYDVECKDKLDIGAKASKWAMIGYLMKICRG